MCKQKHSFLIVRTLDDLIQPQPIDSLFLSSFTEMPTLQKISTVKRFIQCGQVDYIIKWLHISPEFKNICLRDEFSKDWLGLWSTYGIVITGEPSKSLHKQSANAALDLFVGMYFYERAVFYQKVLNNQDSAIVESYLLKAIENGSIHACQMYHKNLYAKIEKDQLDNVAKKMLLMDIISTTKKFLAHYKTYAYFMLAEAYLRYGLYLSDNQECLGDILKIEQAALKCCEGANRHYSRNDPIVFNASMGETLANSNTYLLSTPEEAEAAIKGMFEKIKVNYKIIAAPDDSSAAASARY